MEALQRLSSGMDQPFHLCFFCIKLLNSFCSPVSIIWYLVKNVTLSNVDKSSIFIWKKQYLINISRQFHPFSVTDSGRCKPSLCLFIMKLKEICMLYVVWFELVSISTVWPVNVLNHAALCHLCICFPSVLVIL